MGKRVIEQPCDWRLSENGTVMNKKCVGTDNQCKDIRSPLAVCPPFY